MRSRPLLAINKNAELSHFSFGICKLQLGATVLWYWLIFAATLKRPFEEQSQHEAVVMKANARFEFSGFQTADALVYKNLGKKGDESSFCIYSANLRLHVRRRERFRPERLTSAVRGQGWRCCSVGGAGLVVRVTSDQLLTPPPPQCKGHFHCFYRRYRNQLALHIEKWLVH